MKCNKRTIFLILASAVVSPFILFGCFILFYVCWNPFARQLIPFKATGWQLEAGMHTGKPLSVKPYKTRWPERDVIHLHIVDECEISLSRWFAMDFSDEKEHMVVRDRINILPSPRPHLINWNPGVDILGGKLEGEVWWLSYTGDKVVFSNQVFFVSATQENSGRPPVEVHKANLQWLR